MLEVLNEPIEVLILISEGCMRPLRFRWRGNTIRIRKVTGAWSRLEGVGRVQYFSVLAENSDYYELAYEEGEFRWRLCRAWMEG